jgi:hypothetical protein
MALAATDGAPGWFGAPDDARRDVRSGTLIRHAGPTVRAAEQPKPLDTLSPEDGAPHTVLGGAREKGVTSAQNMAYGGSRDHAAVCGRLR